MALARGDLQGRRVLDPGCGNGVLGIAAGLLGAADVVGVDVDPEAIEVARRNAQRVGVPDTVLMNPPFGAQRRHADLPFLDRALEVGRVVYGFHNAKAEAFVVRRIRSRGARVTDRLEYAFPIPRSFPFHRRDRERIPVVLLRVDAAKG